MKSLTQKTTKWCNNPLSRRFGRYSFFKTAKKGGVSIFIGRCKFFWKKKYSQKKFQRTFQRKLQRPLKIVTVILFKEKSWAGFTKTSNNDVAVWWRRNFSNIALSLLLEKASKIMGKCFQKLLYFFLNKKHYNYACIMSYSTLDEVFKLVLNLEYYVKFVIVDIMYCKLPDLI